MNILLAEDDNNIVKIATAVLTKVGNHQVDVAMDGVSALEKALENTYDLIILDGMMPGLPGVEVCRKYQEQKLDNPAKIIFLSAKSGQEDIKEFNRLGLGLIQKPFVPQDLCKNIDTILENAAA